MISLALSVLVVTHVVATYLYWRTLTQLHEAQAVTLEALARSQEAMSRMQAALERIQYPARSHNPGGSGADATVVLPTARGTEPWDNPAGGRR